MAGPVVPEVAMRRTPVVLLALAGLMGAGVSSAPRAEADCHVVDPACKALRKKAAAFGKEMTAAVRTAILGLKKQGKALAKEVRKGTMEPEEAYDGWVIFAKDTVTTVQEAVDEAHDLTLAEYDLAMADAGINPKLARELEPGCGGAADLLHERARDCMETVRDGLACGGAFKPLQAALHCEEFDVNWQAHGPGAPLTLKQVVSQGGASAPVFPKGAPIFTGSNCNGEIQVLVPSKGSEYSVALYEEDAGPSSNPVAEIAMPDPPGGLFLANFEGLPPGDYRCYVVNETDKYMLFVNGLDIEYVPMACLATVPAWEEEAMACTVTDVQLIVDGVEEDIGPWSSLIVWKTTGGDITQISVDFLESSPEDALEFVFAPSTPVDPATATVNPTDPPDVFYAHTTTWLSIIIEELEILDIGNVLDATPGAVTTIRFSGYALDGVSGTHHPCTGTICLAGANMTVVTLP
jgi:hypothetical protein